MAMSHTHRGPFARSTFQTRSAVCCGCRLPSLPQDLFAPLFGSPGFCGRAGPRPTWRSMRRAFRSRSTASISTFRRPRSATRCSASPARRSASISCSCGPRSTPPDPAVKAGPVTSANTIDRVFVTIADYGNTLPLDRALQNHLSALSRTQHYDRRRRTYGAAVPRRHALSGRGHLVRRAPSRALSRPLHARRRRREAIGMCLFERRIERADLTARFPREWLSDWQRSRRGWRR